MSEWREKRLGEICCVTSSKRIHLADRTKAGIPFYCSKEIIARRKGEEITESDCISIDVYDSIKVRYGVPSEGDILITSRGTYGIPYLYSSNDCFYFADGNLTWLKDFRSEVDSGFLYYYFDSPLGRAQVEALAKGTAQKAVPISGIKQIVLDIPNIGKQREIVGILSTYDELIENSRRQIKLLEEASQRLYREWFVDMRFPGYEDVEFVDGLPSGWIIKSLSEIAEVVMGQSPKSDYYNTIGEGLPFHQGVGSYGERFVVDSTYSTSLTRIAPAGSVLFSVRAPVGRLNITKNKVVIGRGLAAMNHREGCQSLLYYMLKDTFFKDNILGNGSIFSSITKQELLSQKFVVPSMDVALRFENAVSQIDREIALIDKRLTLAIEARNRLLPKLMSGGNRGVAMLANTSEYKESLSRVVGIISNARTNAVQKASAQMIRMYWETGAVLNENAAYGTAFIESLSRDIRATFPGIKGFSVRSLRYMAKFAREADTQLCNSYCRIPWGHITRLLDKTQPADLVSRL